MDEDCLLIVLGALQLLEHIEQLGGEVEPKQCPLMGIVYKDKGQLRAALVFIVGY